MKSIKNFLKRIINFGHVSTQKNIFIKDLLKKNSIIAEASDEENSIMNICSQYSMTPKIRMWALLQSIKHLIKNNIEGDIVETGVFKGGNLILSKKLLNSFNVSNKRIYGYDTF